MDAFSGIHFDQLFHISDIHIRNQPDRRQEYISVFETLFDKLRHACKDCSPLIVITGDLLHSSRRLAPDCIDLTCLLLRTLQSIAPTILIPGNHDDNIRGNSDIAIDAISSILGNNTFHNLLYLKDSGSFPIGTNLLFGHTSVWDYKFVPPNPNTSRINIALFHGILDNVTLPSTEFTLKNCKFKTSNFDGYDIILLGDVHHVQFPQPNAGYAGSLIQQNFGEHITEHGGCIQWNLTTKIPTFIPIPNVYAYVTLRIKDSIFIDPIHNLPPYIRVRLLIMDLTPVQDAESLLQSLDSDILTYITIYDKQSKKQSTAHLSLTPLDGTDPLIQYIKEHAEFSQEERDALVQLHETEYTNDLDSSPGKWKLLSLSLEHFLCFKTTQTFDLASMSLSLIYGKNASGKTSLVRGLLYAIYGKVKDIPLADLFCKDFTKAKPIKTNVTLQLGPDQYIISRTMWLTSTTKRTTKSDVSLSRNSIIVANDLSQVTKYIQSLFGSLDQLIGTNISLQGHHDDLIHTGKSGLLKDLKRILRLDQYDKVMKKIDIQRSTLKKQRTHLDGETTQLQKDLSQSSTLESTYTSLKKEAQSIQVLLEKCPSLQTLPSSKQTTESIQTLQLDLLNTTNSLHPSPTHNLHTTHQLLQTVQSKLDHTLQHSDPNALQSAQQLQEKQHTTLAALEPLRSTPSDITTLQDKHDLDVAALPQLESSLQLIQLELQELQKKQVHSPLEWNPTTYRFTIDKIALLQNESESILEKIHTLETERSSLPTQETLRNIFNSETTHNETLLKITLCEKESEQLQSIIKNDPFIYNDSCTSCTQNKLSSTNTQRLEKLQETITNLHSSTDPTLPLLIKQAHRAVSLDNDSSRLHLTRDSLLLTLKQDTRTKVDLETSKQQKKLHTKIDALTTSHSTLQSNINSLRKTIHSQTQYITRCETNLRETLYLEETLERITHDLEAATHSLQQNNTIIALRKQIHTLRLEETTHLHNNPLHTKIHDINLTIKKQQELLPKCIHAERQHQHAEHLRNQLQECLVQLSGKTELLKIVHAKQLELHALQTKQYTLDSNIKLLTNYISVINYKGFPLECIKQSIPKLQETVNHFLNNIAPFYLQFDFDEDKDSLLLYKIDGPRKILLSNCSGFEIFVSSICIRMAIPHITHTHGADLFIIDEGFGSLDSQYIQALDPLWDILAHYYSLILIITHVEPLQEKFSNMIHLHKGCIV
jgi:exonuclease SbcC